MTKEQSWEMYQWRHWTVAHGWAGLRGKWGKWHKCTKEEYESEHNEALTQKRIITCRPKPDAILAREAQEAGDERG